MSSFFRKLTWLARRRSKEEELQAELQFHLEEEAEEREAAGLAGEEARRAARRDLGNVTLVQESTRAAWSWTFWEQLMQDVRYALRTMSKNKAFTALAALSLALGIGANTAIFSFMDAILMRSLPVHDPETLVNLSWHTKRAEVHGSNRHDDSYNDATGFMGGFFAYPALELFRQSPIFTSVFGYQGTGPLNLTVGRQADIASGEYVSGNYFTGLGVPPAAGRLIAQDDDRAGAPAVAVISFGASRQRFGGPASAVGQSILINNIPFTVVGVAAPEFFGADPDAAPDVYLPMHANLLLEAAAQRFPPAGRFINPDFDWVVIMARLRPGLTPAQAQALLAAPFTEWERTVTRKRTRTDLPTLVVRAGAGGLDSLRRRYSKPLYVLLTLVGLILTIACANLANLLLARAAARGREIAVRLSMGAGRFRVIRQLLTESVLLACLGGALGIAFAVWGIRFLTLLLANGQENFTLRADLNWHVLAVVAALSLLTGILFGLAPAIRSTRVDLMPALKELRTGEWRVRGFRRLSLSRILMVSQIAITLLILVAAGLFARTLSNLASIELGFDRDNVLTFHLDARKAGHVDPGIIALYRDLRTQFSAIPGVRGATMSDLPLIGEGTSGTMISVLDAPDKFSHILTIGSDFFTTMQVPILLGRGIEEQDRPGSPLTAVINQVFAKQFFGEQNPLGGRLKFPEECPKCDIQVVGVSCNALSGRLKETAAPLVYLPFSQGVWGKVGQMVYELRTAGNPLGYVNAVREIVRHADDRMPLADVKTQGALIDATINQEIAFARLCTAFALLALAIACVGLYGTMSYTVVRRTGEIGIRMALGAQPGLLVWMVLREVLILSAVGLAISVPAAFVTSKFVEAFLFGMKPNDPLVLTLASAILLAATLLAGYVPARKASQIDPISALRHE